MDRYASQSLSPMGLRTELASIPIKLCMVMTDQKPNQPEADSQPHPHDFEVQKVMHQQIRNDPDYDDWEYGTEPLPHEAWVAKQASQVASPEPPAAA